MNKKQIIFPIEIKAVNHPRSYILQKAFTNDLNSVELVFRLTDCTTADLTGATASILLFMRDGSFFQDVPTISGTDVKYTLTEAQGNHAGVAQAQLIVKSGTDELASDKQKFEIIAGLETVVATEVMIKDWTMLTAEARAYLDAFAANEVTRQQTAAAAESARAQTFTTNEAARQSTFTANEATRETNETARLTAESGRVTAEQGRTTAESGRVTAESARATAEQGRVSAEALRVTAENNRQAALDAKVPKTTTINGKALSANVSVTAADVPNTPAGGIAATNVQAAINELDTEKANKVQEAWKTPTLLNGATAGTVTPQYYKTSTGVVRFRGNVKVLNNALPFIAMPVGYRPPDLTTVFSAWQFTVNNFTRVLISDGVNLTAINMTNGNIISLDQISYRAEA